MALSKREVRLQRRDLRRRRAGPAGSANTSRRSGRGHARASSGPSVAGSRGNRPPSSTPAKPISAASARMVSTGVSPPSSGMSSLAQAIGLTPKRMVMRLRAAFLELLLVGRPRRRHLGALGHLRHRDVPPGAAGLGASGRVGVDDDHVGPRRPPRARPMAASRPGDAVHLLGDARRGWRHGRRSRSRAASRARCRRAGC